MQRQFLKRRFVALLGELERTAIGFEMCEPPNIRGVLEHLIHGTTVFLAGLVVLGEEAFDSYILTGDLSNDFVNPVLDFILRCFSELALGVGLSSMPSGTAGYSKFDQPR